MAINVTTKWIYPPSIPSSGTHRRAVVNFTANATDATNEANVVKVNRSGLIGPDGINVPQKIAIERIQYHVVNFEVYLYWEEAGGDIAICYLSAGVGTEDNSASGVLDWRPGGQLPPAVPGVADDGDIVLTTSGAADYASYNITMWLKFKGWNPGDTII